MCYRMWLLGIEDTTKLSYWLNWRFLLCAIWVLTPMFAAFYLIWRHEHPPKYSESDTRGVDEQGSRVLLGDDAWRSCWEAIPSSVLLVYRVVGFCLLLVAVCFDVAAHGPDLFHYYTQWTFTLVTIYFGLGSLLSLYGCFRHKQTAFGADNLNGADTEKGLYKPLVYEGTTSGKEVDKLAYRGKLHNPRYVDSLSHIFQILYQMTAGAVMLTDSVYWFVIVPFLSIKEYQMNFLTVLAHSLNLVVLLGETALNSLHFPWFRICYFILWTGFYVIFEWTYHGFEPLWWPYPILDLSSTYAPLWYLIVALLHIPCFGSFVLIVRSKEYVLARWCGRR